MGCPRVGKSDDTPEHFTLEDWSDCLAGLLDNIGIKQAHILGLSWADFWLRYFMSFILIMSFRLFFAIHTPGGKVHFQTQNLMHG